MGSVFYLPGILGTELGYGNPPKTLYWPDVAAMLPNVCRDMTLDGSLAAGPAPGVNFVTPARPLPSHYDRAINQLRADLLGTPFQNVKPWGYDWRQSVLQTGLFLANAIEVDATPSTPCVIVGHSMGGLIARMAYRELSRLGKANLVKRIITLGTPHMGSARIINALNGDFGEGYGYIFKTSVLNALPGGAVAAALLQAQILTMIATWPGFIELLPMIEGDSTDADKGRANAFLPASYTGGGTLFPALLNNARDVSHPALRDPTSIPPGKRLLCIVGTGYPTPYVTNGPEGFLLFGNRLGRDPFTIATNGAGDGTVTERSAQIAGSEVITFECSHDSLPTFTATQGGLSGLILENIDPGDVSPPAPARPPMEQAAPYVAPPLVPPPPPEPPPKRAVLFKGSRGRPIRH